VTHAALKTKRTLGILDYFSKILFEQGLRMRNFTWNRFPIKNLLIDSLLTPIVESAYLNRDMCKFESSQKDESRWQSTDSSKAYRKTVLLSVCYCCDSFIYVSE